MQYLNNVSADIGTETSAHNTSIYMQKQMQYVKAIQMHHLATIYIYVVTITHITIVRFRIRINNRCVYVYMLHSNNKIQTMLNNHPPPLLPYPRC